MIGVMQTTLALDLGAHPPLLIAIPTETIGTRIAIIMSRIDLIVVMKDDMMMN